MRNWLRRAAIGFGVSLAVAELWLVVSDRGVLLSEKRVQPGERYVVPDWGDLGAGGGSLYCRYFTGRNVAAVAYWYSPTGMLGRRACPFLFDPA